MAHRNKHRHRCQTKIQTSLGTSNHRNHFKCQPFMQIAIFNSFSKDETSNEHDHSFFHLRSKKNIVRLFQLYTEFFFSFRISKLKTLRSLCKYLPCSKHPSLEMQPLGSCLLLEAELLL